MQATPARRAALYLVLFAVGAALPGCSGIPRRPPSAWGVEVVALRRSAGGYMLDFRYRVTDPEKAKPLLDRKAEAYLIDEKSGATMRVPDPPKIGPLRQTARQPLEGRTYFVIFANPGQRIKPGDRATVVVGDFRAEHLVVE